MELTGVPGRRKLRRKNSQNRNPLAAATVDNVRPLRRATYNRALGLADYSNDAFNAVWHAGSCTNQCVDTEKGAQRWEYTK